MGGAVSLQQRCRKALVIKAYNARPPEQTLEEQFSAFSYLKNDGQFYTNADLIKQCLKIGAEEYPWIDPLMQVLSGQTQGGDGSSANRSKVCLFCLLFVLLSRYCLPPLVKTGIRD